MAAILSANFLEKLQSGFVQNFIEKDRYLYLLNGLALTIKIAIFALIIGTVIGLVVATIRSTHDMTGKLKFFNFICRIYLTAIRGTPVLLQLLIVYFVIFSSVSIDKSVAAIMAFGFNSGAYVAEIFRSGIMSVDSGQIEAGRSLGLNYIQTMIYIVMPQAFKNVLPALGNEAIVLVKETSVSGYIAMEDLTKGADIIRSQTWSGFYPLFGAAAIYLIVVIVLEKLVGMLERRLKNSER